MRRRPLNLAILVVLALALAIEIDAALAGNAVPQQATGTVDNAEAQVVGPPGPHPPGWIGVSMNGTGSGTVTSVPAGIDCGTTCTHQYPVGTSVTLTATSAAGSTFGGWSGPCTGTATCIVTTANPVVVTATFTLTSPCVVPWVWGKRLAAAERSIESHYCSVGRIKHGASRTVKKGHVLSQKPAPDAQRTPGAKVNLVVSKGRR